MVPQARVELATRGFSVRALPVIGTAVGYHAGSENRVNLVQQHTKAADQGLQRVFRIGALVLVYASFIIYLKDFGSAARFPKDVPVTTVLDLAGA